MTNEKIIKDFLKRKEFSYKNIKVTNTRHETILWVGDEAFIKNYIEDKFYFIQLSPYLRIKKKNLLNIFIFICGSPEPVKIFNKNFYHNDIQLPKSLRWEKLSTGIIFDGKLTVCSNCREFIPQSLNSNFCHNCGLKFS